ncbi:MAG: hypothetical protein Q7S24_01045, partial [bacterium]|nr:hypothetical protein [bacterium]
KDLNKKSVESLAKCGAFDCFGFDRGVLLANSANILAFVHQNGEQAQSNQNSLFANSKIDFVSRLRLEPAGEATEKEKLTWEKELLGLYVTAHPFAPFHAVLQNVLIEIKDLPQQARSTWVIVGGVIETTKKKITRLGKPMMFVTIQDMSSSLELLVFPRTYETTKDVWVEGKMVCVMGKTSEDEEDDKLFVEKAYEVTPENVNYLASQFSAGKSSMPKKKDIFKSEMAEESAPTDWYTIFEDRLEITVEPFVLKNKANEIKMVLAKYPGKKILYIKAGDKKIKTSFLVVVSEGLLDELSGILSA